jgi:hypothetical protein
MKLERLRLNVPEKFLGVEKKSEKKRPKNVYAIIHEDYHSAPKNSYQSSDDEKVEEKVSKISGNFKITPKLNKTIKRFEFILNFDDKPQLLVNLEKIFTFCPEIESLLIYYGHLDYRKNLNYLKNSLAIAAKHLKKLKILEVKGNKINQIDRSFQFSTVEELFIEADVWSDDESLINLILGCKNAKKVKIERDSRFLKRGVHLTFEQFKLIFTTLKDLEELLAAYYFRLSNEIVDFLVNEKLKLKRISLEVAKKDFEAQNELSMRIGRESLIQCILTQEPKTDDEIVNYN